MPNTVYKWGLVYVLWLLLGELPTSSPKFRECGIHAPPCFIHIMAEHDRKQSATELYTLCVGSVFW